MKKLLLAILVFGLSVHGFSQNRKGHLILVGQNVRHELYVCFDPNVRMDAVANFGLLQQEYDFSLEKAYAFSDKKLDDMEASARSKGKELSAIGRVRNTFRLSVPNADNATLLSLATKLEALDEVVYCELLPLEPIAPPSDIAPTTPNYEPDQMYIGPNPGVDMQFAWDAGLSGSGAKIRDVEYGFNKNHEEFNDLAGAFIQPGMTVSSSATVAYTEHGTAVFGIVFADKGAYGVSGMAFGAQEMILFPEWQQSGYNRVYAVSQSIEASNPGDVIIYEMQTYGVGEQYVPAEYDALVWDLTKAATDAGIVIVAAAGNGNQNLDSESYADYMGRGDSGAIIVGAGTPDIGHNKISYSTYGNRVDLQAWGNSVRSTGYGDFSAIFGDFNQRYTNFSGTSSATPIVASCAIVLQSYYFSLSGNYLTSVQMRDVLVSTGIAQGTGGHIGPIPNMQAAMAAVESLAARGVEKLSFALYPNPASDSITISGSLSDKASAVVSDAVGQVVYSGDLREKRIDVSGFSSGIYFVKISDGSKSSVRKIVKR